MTGTLRHLKSKQATRLKQTLWTKMLCSLCPPETRLRARTRKNKGGTHWIAVGAPVVVLRVTGRREGSRRHVATRCEFSRAISVGRRWKIAMIPPLGCGIEMHSSGGRRFDDGDARREDNKTSIEKFTDRMQCALENTENLW